MLFLNKSYKNRKVSLTIHCKYKYFGSTVQRANDRRQKFYFFRLPFAINVKLNLSTNSLILPLFSILFMLSLNKSYKNRKVSLTIHCKYEYFHSTVQRAEDRA